MLFQWLKRYMPRGLFGRTALIVILPVATVALVVSVVFVQRHFDDVTQDMSREVARGLVATLAAPEHLSDPLDFDLVALPRATWPSQNSRHWYDFTGQVVTQTLERFVPGLELVMLPNDQDVVLYLTHEGQDLRVTFDRRRASARNPHQLLVNMAFFGALMTAIAFLYLRNQLRPITRLAAAAEAFGRGQSKRYTPSGAIEVRAAGHAFLAMRARIERQIEQRTLMLSGVSHDMRTPLTRLKLGLEMLDSADSAPLARDVDDLQRLLDAFLAFAKGDAAAGEPETVDPITLVTERVATAQRGGLDVSLAQVEGQGDVMLRALAVSRALENLIGNAVRYGTHCDVSVLITPRMLRIRVEDDGPGIPESDREKAVRPFVRLDPARNQDRGSGVGLGLAIALDVARSHGGSLRLSQSERLGGLCADIVIGR